MRSNGTIGSEHISLTPNPMAPQDYECRVPLSRGGAYETTEIPLLVAVRLTPTGLPLTRPNEDPSTDLYGDPVSSAIVDECVGHSGRQSDYHLRVLVLDCIVDFVGGVGEPDPIIGYTFDGFPS
jgi:hypothetical protein